MKSLCRQHSYLFICLFIACSISRNKNGWFPRRQYGSTLFSCVVHWSTCTPAASCTEVHTNPVTWTQRHRLLRAAHILHFCDIWLYSLPFNFVSSFFYCQVCSYVCWNTQIWLTDMNPLRNMHRKIFQIFEIAWMPIKITFWFLPTKNPLNNSIYESCFCTFKNYLCKWLCYNWLTATNSHWC